MRKHAFWLGTCSALLLPSCSNSTGPRIDKLREALANAQVSLRQSILAGESSVTGSKAIKARLIVISDPEYSVGALGNGMLHDVRINIVNGSVIVSRAVGALSDPCPGSIPIADAIAIAEAKVNGQAVAIEPDDDDHCLREVQVLTASTLWEVKLARDGKVLEVEESDDDNEG